MGGGPKTTMGQQTALPFVLKQGRAYLGDLAKYLFTGQLPGGLFQNDPFPDQQTAGFTPDQLAAFQNVENSSGAAQNLANAGTNYGIDVLGGKYLTPDSNPYIQDLYNTEARGVTDQYANVVSPDIASQFAKSGALGGSAMGDAFDSARYSLGQNLNDLATQTFFGNYQNERANQMSEQQMLPSTLQASYIPSEALLGVGQQEQQQNQTQLDTQYQNAYNKAKFPFSLFDIFGSAISQMGGLGGQSISPNLMGGKGLF